MLTEEPRPRSGARRTCSPFPDWPLVTRWTSEIATPEVDFFAILANRRSRVGVDIPEPMLAATLKLVTMLRKRQTDGRFGNWESRTVPSAGGLHAIRILALPISGPANGGIYDARAHGLRKPDDIDAVLAANRTDVAALCGAAAGVTLQLVCDSEAYGSCYDHPASLIWRDAGAICATAAFVAEALSLRAVILGRHGDQLLRLAGLPPVWTGVGAIHLGAKPDEPGAEDRKGIAARPLAK